MNSQTRYLLASIVESSQDSIVSIDLNCVITSWNKGAEELYGYKATEAIGKPLEMVMLPGDIQGLIKKVKNIIDEVTVPLYETIRLHKMASKQNWKYYYRPSEMIKVRSWVYLQLRGILPSVKCKRNKKMIL